MRLGSAKVRIMRPLNWAANGLRWGPFALWQAPVVVGNTMPKSGSHLIGQILRALPAIGPFLFTPWDKLNRGPGNSKLSASETAARIRSLMRGEVGYANLRATEEFVRLLTGPGTAMIYVYRDPRDLVVSQVFYAVEMHTEHALHDYATNTLKNMEERLDLFILGNSALDTPNIRRRYDSYAGWLEQTSVLKLRFEALILNRRPTLQVLLDYLEHKGFVPTLPPEKCIEIFERAIVPKKSPTFRRGQPGNWKEYFSEQNKRHFKEVTADLLVSLGYESNEDW